jgi:hypothetical protein
MTENSGLSDRQVMILSHVVNSALRDGNSAVESMKDLRGSLQRLGATDEDMAAMASYLTDLANKVRQNNNVGFW